MPEPAVADPSEDDPAEAALALFLALDERGLRLACAESCTGGLVTAAITGIPGSSRVLWGGVTAYSNECKVGLLGVEASAIEGHGAVSREVAAAMAEGVLRASGADLGLAVTGVAGPGGGSADKPVGLVWFAWRARDGRGSEARELFPGARDEVRRAAAARSMRGALALALGFGGAVDKAVSEDYIRP
jgi:nicotinamide-nucleotide amidase